LCLYIEFSNLSTKMFAYRHFRHNGYFPVKWMTIHNSLHSLPPAERLTPRAKAHIEHGTNSGVKTQTVKDYDDFRDFYRMLRRFFSLKLRRFLPSERLFYELGHSSSCDLFITKYNEKVIGGCAVVYSDNDAYLWYMGSRRKRYAHLHPGTMTVWHALEEAHRKHCHHFHFMDVGLPFRKDMRREFILRFGGKPVGSYRWFYCTIGWLNKTIGWLFRE
jgi:23S rRNA C2498 (ribose-2'-O)-methylase RlmM